MVKKPVDREYLLKQFKNYDTKVIENIRENVTELQVSDITHTTDTYMPGSYEGSLKIDEIGGRCEQLSTTGYNLLDLSDAKNGTSSGVTVIMNSDGSYSYTGTATDTAVNVWLLGNWNLTDVLFTLPASTYYIQGVNLYNGTAPLVQNYGNNGQLVTFSVDTNVTGVRAVQAVLNETYNETIYPMIAKSDVELPWEPYTGGVASPNPNYPQEIKTVKGKNILDCRGLTERVHNGVTFTPVYDDKGDLEYINVNGTATAEAVLILNDSLNLKDGEKYVLNGCPSGGSSTTYRLDIVKPGVANYMLDVGAGSPVYTHTSENINPTARIRIGSGYTANNLRFYPMLRPASVSDGTYVPYGLVRIKTSSKNFYNYNKIARMSGEGLTINSRTNGVLNVTVGGTGFIIGFAGQGTSKPLTQTSGLSIDVFPKVTPGKTYTFSFESDLPRHHYYVQCYDRDGNSLLMDRNRYWLNGEDNKITFVAPENAYVVNCNVQGGETTAGRSYNIWNMQLEEGDTVTEWEPYIESSVTLSEPIELCGLKDIQDKIIQQDGVWGIERNVVIDDLKNCDWNEQWNTSYPVEGSYIAHTSYFNANAKYFREALGYIACTHFKEMNREAALYSSTIGVWIGGGSVFNLSFRVPTSIANSASELKQYFTDNDVKFYYLSNKPAFTPLPVEDQIALNSLKTFNGATYLELDCYLEPTFKGQYGTSEVGAVALQGCNEGCIADINSSDHYSNTGIHITSTERNNWNNAGKNVLQSPTSTEYYRPLIFGSTYDPDINKLTVSTTGAVYTATNMYAQPGKGMIASTSYKIGEKVTVAYNSTTESLDFTFL